jgi:diadenosine tetraphosphatase ApaH/serine/threonine PP2A family protein phosphatase
MRIAVISDIHGNEHALTAVLEEVDATSPDAIWCLGDVVGYGPSPNECCALLEKRADICLVGNHDLVVLGKLDVTDFNGDAATAALWAREQLNESSREFLARLAPSAEAEGVQLFHASPRDPVWDYVLSAEAAYASLQLSHAPIVLVGHSHVALGIGLVGDDLRGGSAPEGARIELEGRWLLNPGSVGQPRDGDPRAAWMLLDTDQSFAEFHRVAYPIELTQAAMRASGLPEPLAARLAQGI